MPTITQYVNHVQLIDGIVARKCHGLTHADTIAMPANNLMLIARHAGLAETPAPVPIAG